MSGQETSPVGPPDSGAMLHVVRRDGTEIVALSGRRRLRIGRSAEADIVVDEPTVSRLHLEIRLGAQPAITDLGSSNGTVVGGVRMAPRDSRALRMDETIEIGTVFLILRAGSTRGPSLRRADVHRILGRAAQSTLPVLLLGGSGTGRKTLARETAGRAGLGQVVELPCAALSKVDLPDTQALILCDVDRTPQGVQPLLATALGAYPGRIFATAGQELPVEGLAAGFDLTLFRAVSGIRVLVPSLRDDPAAIVSLAREMLAASAQSLSQQLSSAAEQALSRHPFTGELAELRAILERAQVMAAGPVIDVAQLLLEEPVSAAPGTPDPDADEKQRILSALGQTAGNQTRAAALLGFSRRTLTNKLNKYGISRPRKKPE